MVSVILFLLLYARVGLRLWRACQRDRGQGHPDMAVGILEAAAGQIATATRRTSMLRIWTPGACQKSSAVSGRAWSASSKRTLPNPSPATGSIPYPPWNPGPAAPFRHLHLS